MGAIITIYIIVWESIEGAAEGFIYVAKKDVVTSKAIFKTINFLGVSRLQTIHLVSR